MKVKRIGALSAAGTKQAAICYLSEKLSFL